MHGADRAPLPRESSASMSRRAKKQQSDRAPVSGTRVSNKSRSQRKQERRKAQPVLAVVRSAVASSVPASASPPVVELAPGGVADTSPLPAASRAAERPLADEALPDVELSFFEGWSAPAPSVAPGAVVEPPQSLTDDVDSLLLTPAQQERRQWFRRQVTTLIAGMGALGTVAVVARLASLL